MNSNSDNPHVGKAFQDEVLKVAEQYFKKDFQQETAVEIGNPAKPHKFDVVSEDKKIIIECKCYTWTEGGNVPSAKMATLDEAILYMRSVPYPATKIIAMKKDVHPRRQITLADYFCDKKAYLMDDIQIWEFDDSYNFRIVKE